MDYTAVILAGGAARRLGGVDKAALVVAGTPMIVRVLRAVDDAVARVVVGPPRLPILPDVLVVRERPPGGGPVAAVAAAFEQTWPSTEFVALLGGDLPLLTAGAIARLRDAMGNSSGAVFVDADGREQWLCGMWRTVEIAARLDQMEHVGAPLRRLLKDLGAARVTDDAEMPPWFDCDTADEIRRAEEWLTR